MKPLKILTILIILLPLLGAAQQKTKFTYREPPKTGEIFALAGIALVAITATGLMHNTSINPTLPKVIGVVGGCLIFTGVVIDLNGKGSSIRYKRKGNKRSIRVRF